MLTLVNDYFRELTERFGSAWNRFWFLPSDPLTLSVLRVLTGAVAFYTILTYTPDLIVFFGPDGLLSAGTMRSLEGQFHGFSYLFWCTTPTQLWAAHVAGLAVLALFTCGLFSRLTAVLSAVVVLSYMHRAVFITSNMEPILALVMVYLCLGPSGAYLSLDRLLRRRRPASQPVAAAPADALPPSWGATVALRLIQVHLTIVYVMMTLAQLNENTWWEGTAMWWLAGRRDSALVDLTWLYAHPWLVNVWTHGFVVFEAAFAVLVWNRLAAPLIIGLGVVAWGLMALVTGLVPLAVIMVVASLAFVPANSMRKLLGCCGLSALVE